MADIVKVEITAPLPAGGVVNTAYKIDGTVKLIEEIGAPPWVYAVIKKKEWYRPEVLEEQTYERGFPMPFSGDFSIKWKPEKTGIYEVTIVATPAPLSLPVVGLVPIIGTSDMMKITVGEKPEVEFGLEILSCSFT